MPGDAGLIYKLRNPSSTHLPYENESSLSILLAHSPITPDSSSVRSNLRFRVPGVDTTRFGSYSNRRARGVATPRD